MNKFDIIPDIYGQSAKLEIAPAGLGWRRIMRRWTHPNPNRQIVFREDFIDRGPDNQALQNTVRELVDAGKARAIMSNHEINAFQFHTLNRVDGAETRGS